MAGEPARKSVKVGVHRGGGPPPGYEWNLLVLDAAFREAKEFLNDDQYEHIARQFRELAGQDDPTHSDTIEILQVEDFYELKDKWGILGKICVRVFFHVEKSNRTIVALHSIHKQNNGPTPRGAKINARYRMRHYVESLRDGA